jgi:hypothetical protein
LNTTVNLSGIGRRHAPDTGPTRECCGAVSISARISRTRLVYMTDEAAEGRDAFLEKRLPDWSRYRWYYPRFPSTARPSVPVGWRPPAKRPTFQRR